MKGWQSAHVTRARIMITTTARVITIIVILRVSIAAAE